MTTAQKAELLHSLHERRPLVLPNAWDPASAVLIEAAGAAAIATTSGGTSWAAGAPDAGGLGRDAALDAVRRVAAAVSVPVTADIEAGYGITPDEVATTITEVIAAGAAGVNIEDGTGDRAAPLFEIGAQAERLAAAREAAEAAGVRLCLNARTDVFLAGTGSADERLAAVLERAERYAAAGADVLFVPGVGDRAAISALVAGPLPVNVMVHPGAPSVPELAELGVARVSVGTAIAQAAYGLAAAAARELLGPGTYGALENGVDYGELNGLLRRAAEASPAG
ncbi:isocitrate lyase/PEP mutase family protein [Spirillospora sp. CA-294931]|uniref:isocitrate lyase/PEP mutase family protein n=1 Tax=Spirillospora sp. CA-294931 TaxID=3240042 RepID=UPI003D9144A4